LPTSPCTTGVLRGLGAGERPWHGAAPGCSSTGWGAPQLGGFSLPTGRDAPPCPYHIDNVSDTSSWAACEVDGFTSLL